MFVWSVSVFVNVAVLTAIHSTEQPTFLLEKLPLKDNLFSYYSVTSISNQQDICNLKSGPYYEKPVQPRPKIGTSFRAP